MDDEYYKNKYIKYKNKYLDLKILLGGEQILQKMKNAGISIQQFPSQVKKSAAKSVLTMAKSLQDKAADSHDKSKAKIERLENQKQLSNDSPKKNSSILKAMKTAATSVASSPTRLKATATNAINTINKKASSVASSVASSATNARTAFKKTISSAINTINDKAISPVRRPALPKLSEQKPVPIPVEPRIIKEDISEAQHQTASPKLSEQLHVDIPVKTIMTDKPNSEAQHPPASNKLSEQSHVDIPVKTIMTDKPNSEAQHPPASNKCNDKVSELEKNISDICMYDKYNFVYNILNLDKPIQKCIKNYTAYSIEKSHNQTINNLYNSENIQSFRLRILLLTLLNNEKYENPLNELKDLANLLISNIEQKNEGLDDKCKPFNKDYLKYIRMKAINILKIINDCDDEYFLKTIQPIIKKIGESHKH
jgi:hypothetical protein